MSASSSPSPPRLHSLPPEIVRIITHHTPNQDLQNLRLINRTISSIATESLFRRIFLNPTKDAISRWTSILNDDHIHKIPHHAIIHSRRAVDWAGSDGLDAELGDYDADQDEDDPLHIQYDADDEPSDHGEKRRAIFANAISDLIKIPHLRSLEIGFTPRCVGLEQADPYNPFEVESFANRLEFLRTIFHHVNTLVQTTSSFRSLTIQNLQNFPTTLPSEPSSPFPSVMSRLEELHIGMVTEINEHGPDYDHERIELRTFPPHFVSEWLCPISHNLKSLSLYDAMDNWGPLPGEWDFSRLSFPRLTTLSLGYYTIAHHDQMDWILRQKSLRKLVMDNCMILSDIRLYNENLESWNLSTSDWEAHPTEEDDRTRCFRYHGGWSQFFDKIADGLPNLEEFCFEYRRSSTYSNREKDYSVVNRSTGKAKVHPRRYVEFDIFRWHEAGDDGTFRGGSIWDDVGQPEKNRTLHQECLAEDQKSLDRLLDRCRERRTAAAAAAARE